MTGEFAGVLRERVEIENRLQSRDAIGGASGDYVAVGSVWAAILPIGNAEPVEAGAASANPRWQVVLRRREGFGLNIRILWRGRKLAVRSIQHDPRQPEKVTLICEEQR